MTEPRINARHASVYELATDLALDESAYRRALEIAKLTPDNSDWRRYIDHFPMTIGSVLIVAGIAAFFSWKWADLSHIHKFVLI